MKTDNSTLSFSVGLTTLYDPNVSVALRSSHIELLRSRAPSLHDTTGLPSLHYDQKVRGCYAIISEALIPWVCTILAKAQFSEVLQSSQWPCFASASPLSYSNLQLSHSRMGQTIMAVCIEALCESLCHLRLRTDPFLKIFLIG